MYQHHKDAIGKAIKKLSEDKKVLAVILGGSVAHGFAAESSDIDLMLVLSEGDYQQALHQGDLHYVDKESANYPGGYVEGKYISESFIKAVAEKGSEPARFAFKDAILLYSCLDNINDLISAASAYPKHNKEDNLEKFNAQFEGWYWMYHEGLKTNDLYVINYAVTNLCLFAGRLLLAHNEILYPYHKWFLRVLETAPARPSEIIKTINTALITKTESDVSHLYHSVKKFHDWPQYQHGWVAKFVIDSEVNWLNGSVPIADL